MTIDDAKTIEDGYERIGMSEQHLTEIQRLEGEAIIAADRIKGAEAAIGRLAAENGELRHAKEGCDRVNAESLAAIERLERRWQHAEPFVNAAIDLYNEALEGSFATSVPKFDRRDVTAALAPAMNGLVALHETFQGRRRPGGYRRARQGTNPGAAAEAKRGKTMKIHGRHICKLGQQALADGNDSLATLCEIALGGDGPLNQIARRSVEDLIRRGDTDGAPAVDDPRLS